jgi:pimeloyl-ACP methyl ester carboxylesterase
MERMRTEGAELEYEVSGTGEPVVFIHGALIADTFRPLLAEPSFAGRYQHILYHRRGYAGSSPPSAMVSVARQAADCRALLRHLGVERAHVVGHSYGGVVALQLALDSPVVVHSLALLEPAMMIGPSAQDYRASLARSAIRYRNAGAAVVVDEFLRARWPAYHDALDLALPGAFAQAVSDAGTLFEYELPGLLDWHFSETDARRIGQPVLSVLGCGSVTLGTRFGETHRLLQAWLPSVDEFVLPGATHFLTLEDPRGMAEALAAFWAKHRLPDSTD